MEIDTLVEESIIFDDVNTGVRIKSGVSIGYDLEVDARKGCTISDKGIAVVPKGMVIGRD